MHRNRFAFREIIGLTTVLWMLAAASACAQQTEIDSFITEAPSSIFAFIHVGDVTVALLAHKESLRSNGVVSGDVYALAFRGGTDLVGWHRGHLYSDHAPGFAHDTEYVFQMYNPETYESELAYFNTEDNTFRIYPVPARFIGRVVIWNREIFYSTEIYDDTIHCVNMDDGETHFVAGSGEVFSNTDFWIIDGDLFVTEYGDRGAPHRLDTDGLYPAPDVVVSEETKVGFNLRTIRGGEDLERFEELLGIR